MGATATNSVRTRNAWRARAAAVLLPPVVERELRAALHRRDARKSRLRAARGGVIFVAILMLFGLLTGAPFFGVNYLFFAGLYLAVRPAIQTSVGLFAEERRQQTLELLYLTGMGSAELFIGKLLGGALVASGDLLALAPVMAVPFLSGGLSFDLFAATVACLPTVFVLVLAVGSLASALCKEEGTALVVAGVLLGILCLALPLPYNMGFWLAGTAPFAKSWLVFSPALGPWLVAKNFSGFTVGDFWTWTAAMWVWSGLCLVLAAVVLKWNWRRDVERACAGGWSAKWEAFARGSAAWRDVLRRRVLPLNAYQWLAQRDRRPVLQAWGFIGAVCALWLLGWCAWPGLWAGTVNLVTTSIVLLAGVDVFMSYTAARLVASDRRDGAIELLLTTPLSPKEMMEGQEAALREQFRPIKQGLSLLLGLLLLARLAGGNWTLPEFIVYPALWSVLFAWCWWPASRSAPLPMWVAANCARPVYAMFRTGGGTWNYVWTIFWLWNVGVGAVTGLTSLFAGTSSAEIVVVVTAVVVVLFVMALKLRQPNLVREQFVRQLRAVAQEPVPDRHDPRFKIWKTQLWTRFSVPAGTPLPPGHEDWSLDKPVRALGAWFWRPLGKATGTAWRELRKAAKRR